MKKSFILYLDQSETFQALTNEQAGKLIKAIFNYSKGVEPKLDKTLSLVFIPIKNQLERDEKKWKNIVQRNKENIGKRWKKEAKKNTTGISGIPNTLDNDNDNDNDIKKEIKKEKTAHFYSEQNGQSKPSQEKRERITLDSYEQLEEGEYQVGSTWIIVTFENGKKKIREISTEEYLSGK